MRERTLRILAVTLLVAFAAGPVPNASDAEQLLAFGTEMARGGNWREAEFRWKQAESAEPGNGRVLNNLAVAREVFGDGEGARALYEKSIAADSDDVRIRENAFRAGRLWSRIDKDSAGLWEFGSVTSRPAKKGRDAVEVHVSVSLPPRLDLSSLHSVLVASFLVEENDLLDTNREMVRFVRAEFRKRSALEVLDVTPAPPVPEQTVDAMAENVTFWRRLAREHHADLVVSGRVDYQRHDSSGFQDVDVISEQTGQKVRQTRFVEQETFVLDLDILFFRGADGTLMHRDKLRREASFPGLANDPITAFFRLAEGIAADVRAAVGPRSVQDARFLFKN